MPAQSVATANGRGNHVRWWPVVALLGVVLGVLFHDSFAPRQILFANDGPLGFLMADCNRLPERFLGTWRNLSWLGGEGPAASPTISMLLLTAASPVMFLKTFAPFTLFFVGFSAWVFFRQLQFNPAVCLLGAMAAALNMHFFSIACWGLGTWNVAAGMIFLALAALCAKSVKQFWARAMLAGLAVGMGLMDGYDVGAILSIYVGVFAIFWVWISEAPAGQKVMRAALTEGLVIFFAAFIAAHTILTLVGTQVQGVAAMEQDVTTKQQRWNSATQWSLPKMETIEIMVPGIFGYRMARNITERDRSSAYWGGVGRDPRIAKLQSAQPTPDRLQILHDMKMTPELIAAIDNPDPQAHKAAVGAIVKKSGIYWRYCGSGECAGVLVSLLAIFALSNIFRANSPLSRTERLSVGFWGIAALFSLLAAWGRYGFLYGLLYHLPYFSTVRNPIKFLHPFHLAWIILAAYGMEMLWRRYLRGAGPARASSPAPTSGSFEKRWTVFGLLLIAAAVVGWLLMLNSRSALIGFLENQDFPSSLAYDVIKFSMSEVVWFIVYLVLSIVLLLTILKGSWSGSARMAWIFLGVLMFADLARADVPWIRYYDYEEKYSPNPIVDFLKDKPYEHRAIGKLEPKGPGSGITQGLGELYFFWLQNDFPYHNIQTLDFSQMPRTPEMDKAYLKNFELAGSDIRTTDLWPAMRLWQLTNTRYILSMANTVDFLNARVDPIHHSFRLQTLFDIHRKVDASSLADYGDLTVEEGPKGTYAMAEYTAALPRAKLFARWEAPTNDAATLRTLASRDFDPLQTVLVSQETPLAQAAASTNADPGTVSITDYRTKRVILQAEAKTPAVLLFNERINPDWKLWVDNKPAPILRCNYIMRGVFLTPGSHTVDFRFEPSLKTLYVSLLAIAFGIGLAGYLFATRSPATAAPAGTAPVAKPESAPSPAPSAPIKASQPPPPPNNGGGKQKGKGAKAAKSGPGRKS
ncbi:MAG: hypothetical protein ACLQVY_29875 [Limisphaerales bacterium]